MGKSKCPSCQQEVKFESSIEEIDKASFKVAIIRCPKCKTAIGVVDGFTLENVLEIKQNLNR